MFFFDINFILSILLKLFCVFFLVLVRRFFNLHAIARRKTRVLPLHLITALRINLMLNTSKARAKGLDPEEIAKARKKYEEELIQAFKHKNRERIVLVIAGGVLCFVIFLAVGTYEFEDDRY